MDLLGSAGQLAREGKFSEALTRLDGQHFNAERRTAAELLRAELFEHLGEHQKARSILQRFLRTRELTDSERSLCYYISGRLLAEQNLYESAVEHLQKSAVLALRIKDYERAAWAQYKLLAIVADTSGWDSVAPLITELRNNAARSENPQLMAAVHLSLAEAEAKIGHVAQARRHIVLATDVLSGSPNVWLQAIQEHIDANVAIFVSDLDRAARHATLSVKLARESGAKRLYAVCVATLGHIFCVMGQHEAALQHFDSALAIFGTETENFAGVLDDIARIRLAQQDFDSCAELLERIESFATTSFLQRRYVYRHSMLTRVYLEIRRQNFDLAHHTIDRILNIAQVSRDQLLETHAQLLKAALFCKLQQWRQAAYIVEDLRKSIGSIPPDLYAFYETIIGTALLTQDTASYEAVSHLERATRVYEVIRQRPLDSDVTQFSTPTTTKPVVTESRGGAPLTYDLKTIEAFAALTSFTDRPVLLALEAAHVLSTTLHDSPVAVVEHSSSGIDTVIREFGKLRDLSAAVRINVATTEHGAIQILCDSERDIEAAANINALCRILDGLQEVRQARTDRESRTAVWPAEARNLVFGDSVVTGHMMDIMMFAKRVAQTNVLVLVTGESGTGKEIVARAVHSFSDRADHPFVPFNCAAIPPHLLESQLFGHRRGAFTGAEADYIGIIRSARRGTLFLDEIGELSLELQPKLLRFLESGEISPLGETESLHVDVRIVAATNRSLEQAVRDGLFREDLFYRVNVVRLALKPLRERRDEIPQLVEQFVARAAKDFNKGHIDVAEETMERLLLYRWPGNVRQLSNEIRRMVALVEADSVLQPYMISNEIVSALPVVRSASGADDITVPLHGKLTPTIERIEREMIKAALQEHQGKVDEAAKALGISRKGLYLKRHRFGL